MTNKYLEKIAFLLSPPAFGNFVQGMKGVTQVGKAAKVAKATGAGAGIPVKTVFKPNIPALNRRGSRVGSLNRNSIMNSNKGSNMSSTPVSPGTV